MAHYDAHRNRGYDGYGMKKPIYVGYSATAESYLASSEQVVTMGGYPTMHDQVWPRSSTRAQLKKGDEYDHSPRFGHTNGSPRDSPRKTFHTANSPPTGHYFRDERGGGSFSSNDDDSSDDEVECRDGVCYPKPKHGGRQGYDYDKEKKKTNGYAAGNYPQPHSPRKDSHHQTSEPHKYYNTEKLPEGNNIYGSHTYNVPAHTKPTADAYYDRFSYPASNNDHHHNNYTHSKNDPYVVPAPIKTRPDRSEAGKFVGENGRSSPVSAVANWTPFAAAPRKGHQGKPDVIDSTEAQRRYSNAPPQYGPPADSKYGAAIDSETAARKYGGVFVK